MNWAFSVVQISSSTSLSDFVCILKIIDLVELCWRMGIVLFLVKACIHKKISHQVICILEMAICSKTITCDLICIISTWNGRIIVIIGACKVRGMLRVFYCVVERQYWWKPAPVKLYWTPHCWLHSYLQQEVWCDVRAAATNTTWEKKRALASQSTTVPYSCNSPLGQNREKSFQCCQNCSEFPLEHMHLEVPGHLSSLPHLCSLFYDVDLLKKYHVPIIHLACAPSMSFTYISL